MDLHIVGLHQWSPHISGFSFCPEVCRLVKIADWGTFRISHIMLYCLHLPAYVVASCGLNVIVLPVAVMVGAI